MTGEFALQVYEVLPIPSFVLRAHLLTKRMQANLPNRIYNNDFEFIRYFRHKCRNLFHQSVNAAFTSRLK